MNKWKKLGVAFAGLAVAALLISAGGLIAMHELNLPDKTMVPHPIVFAMMMVGVLTIFSLISMAVSQGRLWSKYS